MIKAPVQSVSWTKVVLAVLPGVWLVLQQSIHSTETLFSKLALFVSTTLISVGIVLTSILIERRFSSWCLPALGSLLWKIWDTKGFLSYAQRAKLIGPLNRITDFWDQILTVRSLSVLLLLAAGVAMLVAIVGSGLLLYWVYRQFRKGKTWLVWVFVGLLAVVSVVIQSLSHLYRWYVTGALLDSLFFFLPLLTVPVALGLVVAKTEGVAASLVAVACEPVWIDMLYSPRGAINTQLMRLHGTSDVQGLEVALLVLAYLPHLSFLVVIPAGLLRARSENARLRWLVVPSCLTLVAVVVTRALALEGTEFAYTSVEWVRSSLYVIQLAIPLLLAGTLYRRFPQLDEAWS